MKKSTKIILPALAVLVLGTAATATGTVAWFAANGVVSASGMEVKCATSKNLVITNFDPSDAVASQFTDGDNYGANVKTTNTGCHELSPSSTTDTVLAAESPAFYYVSSQNTIGAVNGEIKVNSVITAATNDNTHYAEHDFWLANSATADMDLSVKTLTVTDADGNALDANISKALRVGISYNDQVASGYVSRVYGVVTGFTATYQGLNGAGTVTDTTGGVITTASGAISASVTATNASTAITASTGDKLGSIKSTTQASDPAGYTWSSMKVFVWYEGQDANCISSYALTVEEVKIAISFEATAKTGA